MPGVQAAISADISIMHLLPGDVIVALLPIARPAAATLKYPVLASRRRAQYIRSSHASLCNPWTIQQRITFFEFAIAGLAAAEFIVCISKACERAIEVITGSHGTATTSCRIHNIKSICRRLCDNAMAHDHEDVITLSSFANRAVISRSFPRRKFT